MGLRAVAAAMLGALAFAALGVGLAQAQDGAADRGDRGRGDRGSVIFLHPDGTGPNHWQASRTYWQGPDAVSNWDRLEEMAVYRGMMADLLAGTSNGGATTHAFGYRVEGLGSFGKDGNGLATPPSDRFVNSLSGYPGSIMREAAARRHPVGVVNDGSVTEPGSGAFLAEVGNRNDNAGIALQMLNGRTQNETARSSPDRDPRVILGGGERWFLPAPGGGQTVATSPSNGYHGWGSRTDGRDLIREAQSDGYRVIRTRAEYESLMNGLRSRQCERRNADLARCAPKVLGLFARNDTFNDTTEERLIAGGLRDPRIAENDKRSNLLLYGTRRGLPNPNNVTDGEQIPQDQVGANGRLLTQNGENPPTVAEMTEMALLILSRAERQTDRPFMLVAEPESPDNFGNNDNAIGTLTATKRSDDAIGEALEYGRRDRDALVITAADSDAGGMQLLALTRNADGSLPNVPTVNVNPTGDSAQNFNVQSDGLYGRGTVAFEAADDQFGQQLPFGIVWVGTNDVQGGIISRASGGNAGLMDDERFSQRFDNVDVYRMMYDNLFGRLLPYPEGQRAPDRG